jgi:hypothetical protein
LLHDGRLDPVQRLRNFESPILTVGTEPAYELNREGDLVNRDGSVIALIHQYDRHPELVRIFEEKAVDSAWRRFIDSGAYRLRRVPRLVRRVLATPRSRS